MHQIHKGVSKLSIRVDTFIFRKPTSHDLQQKLHPELGEVPAQKVPDDVEHEHAGYNLEIVQLGEEDDEIRAFFAFCAGAGVVRCRGRC